MNQIFQSIFTRLNLMFSQKYYFCYLSLKNGKDLLQFYNIYFEMKAILLLLFVVISISIPDQGPVIGIFTQTNDADFPTDPTNTFISASYVKYVQASGAQVIPIFAYSKDKSYFDKILSQINGVIFTGGDQEIDIKNIWTQNADYVFKYAINQTKIGNPFALWGICLGWQLLAYLSSGYDSKTLTPVRGQDGVINTLTLYSPSYLFDDLSEQIRYSLVFGTGIVYFSHNNAVLTNFTKSNQDFKDFWNIVSTTKSPYNEDFISGAESLRGPFFGTQFHPQKNAYEWKIKADRSENGISVAQILSNKFIQQARASKNRFSSIEELNKAIIYNYEAKQTSMGFTQIYTFKEIKSSEQNQQKEVNLSTQ